MPHYSDEQWFEFALRLLSPAKMAAMQRHLAKSCELCEQRSAIWQMVAATASREVQYQVPDEAARLAKAAFAAQYRLQRIPKHFKLARLFYDTFSQPVPVGVRTATLTGRHLLHYAEPWTIHVYMEIGAGNRLSLVGQVLRSKRKPTERTGIEVTLKHGDKPLAKAATNRFGEFKFECDYQRDLQINLALGGEAPIQITLPACDERHVRGKRGPRKG
jgi:hypothetical protein